ncbi:MAG: methionyl-tRNA formyltransferase [Candidatus Omnitrophica bacterium]|nr:methionyl-tRNA formyltransferase [Candidatus Omnitrophota bacterium]
MKIIFFGSSRFSVPTLENLYNKGFSILAVVTQPDRQKGRGLKVGMTPVKVIARKLGLDVFQPEDINSYDSLSYLRGKKPDIFVILAYGQKFSKECLDIPAIMPINCHASLLPKYRGAAPINWAIINGEKETGNTIMKVIPQMDAGPIILQSRIKILPEDDSLTMEEKLSKNAAELMVQALDKIKDGSVTLTGQDKSQVSFAPRLKEQDIRIKWDKTAEQVHNLIRGALSWQAAYTYFRKKRLLIYRSSVLSSSVVPDVCPGTVTEVTSEGICVACGRGIVRLHEIQLEGRRRMNICEFLCGHRIKTSEIFL